MHICFELSDAFHGEGMRDGLALTGVLCAIASVEKTALDGDKNVIVIPFENQMKTDNRGRMVYSRFQEAISMSVDSVDGTVICDRDVIGLDPDQLSIFLVCLVHSLVSLSLSSL